MLPCRPALFTARIMVLKRLPHSHEAALYFKEIACYFSRGLVEVSLAGIGNRSTCPGLGSGLTEGK